MAPGQVVVIGGGMVGYNSAVIALGLGANVTIIERSIDRMRHLEEVLGSRVTLLMSSSLQIEESVADADVVIGAVLIPGALAPKLVTRSMVAGMKAGLGRRRRCNRPGRLPRDLPTDDAFRPGVRRRRRDALLRDEHARRRPVTATKALTNATLPYVEAIADHGLAEAVARDPALARGVNVLDGRITYEAVADAHGLEYAPLEDVLPLSPV